MVIVTKLYRSIPRRQKYFRMSCLMKLRRGGRYLGYSGGIQMLCMLYTYNLYGVWTLWSFMENLALHNESMTWESGFPSNSRKWKLVTFWLPTHGRCIFCHMVFFLERLFFVRWFFLESAWNENRISFILDSVFNFGATGLSAPKWRALSFVVLTWSSWFPKCVCLRMPLQWHWSPFLCWKKNTGSAHGFT
jgi:hypothetical protein